MLAEGLTVVSVAERLGCSRMTVADWRDSPDGAAELARATAERRREFEDTVAPARAKLKHLAMRAVEVLATQLESTNADVASKAARTILDRVGLPRAERVEVSVAQRNLSALSDDELRIYDALNEKALSAGVSSAGATSSGVSGVGTGGGEGGGSEDVVEGDGEVVE